jgi:hypothetical protein
MCSEELEASMQRLRNPRLIIYNVPHELNIENVKELIMKQSSELCIEKDYITPRYLFKDKKKANNLVTGQFYEVSGEENETRLEHV